MNPSWLFAVGVLGLASFEAANVYFIMPFPGSQRMQSLELADRLYRGRLAGAARDGYVRAG